MKKYIFILTFILSASLYSLNLPGSYRLYNNNQFFMKNQFIFSFGCINNKSFTSSMFINSFTYKFKSPFSLTFYLSAFNNSFLNNNLYFDLNNTTASYGVELKYKKDNNFTFKIKYIKNPSINYGNYFYNFQSVSQSFDILFNKSFFNSKINIYIFYNGN